jgi:hypothetical protein
VNGLALCINMGRRSDLLGQTFAALLQDAQFDSIIAINDCRYEETNQVLKNLVLMDA